jgi:hypothetical protein
MPVIPPQAELGDFITDILLRGPTATRNTDDVYATQFAGAMPRDLV